jgi:hypothetical protein
MNASGDLSGMSIAEVFAHGGVRSSARTTRASPAGSACASNLAEADDGPAEALIFRTCENLIRTLRR